MLSVQKKASKQQLLDSDKCEKFEQGANFVAVAVSEPNDRLTSVPMWVLCWTQNRCKMPT